MPDIAQSFASAVAAHQTGDFATAEECYRDVLAVDPNHFGALCNLGVVYVRLNRPDAAADCYQRAITVDPNSADAYFNLGNLFRRYGRLPDADTAYRACLNLNPAHVGAGFNLGLTLTALGDIATATQCFQAVVRLAPHDLEAHLRLGDSLTRIGNLAEGIAVFRAAVALAPHDSRPLYNLGLALTTGGNPGDAETVLRQALALRPDYPEAHNALGLMYESSGRKDEAEESYRAAVQVNPDFPDSWSNLGVNLCEQGRAEEAIDCMRKSLVARPMSPPIHGNLLLFLNYSSRISPADVFAEHRAWAERYAPGVPPAPPIPEPHDPNRRLRIGYLSADFRSHTVAGFIEELLTHHNRDAVEVFAYASVQRPDATTERLQKLADHWRPIAALSDARAAALIRSDAIDVLIDLGGHTASNRLLVLAHRQAPIQATVFGYANTTGLPSVDYRITDALSDPPGMTEAFNTETLLRLPVAWVYQPPKVAPAVAPLPAATAREFVFGSLNNPAKLSDACFAAWVEILKAVPESRLILLAGQSKNGSARLAERFAKAGIAANRVELLPRMSKPDYFAAHHRIDVGLDPYPFNGGVTTADALWMGVPVLTVAGPTYVARQGVAMMTQIGLPGFVAETPMQLPQLAQTWNAKRAELAAIRASLRDRLTASPYCDSPGYVRNLEASLRDAWRTRLSNQS